MKNIKIECEFIQFDLYHEKQIELYVNKIPTDKTNDNLVRFVYLIEPFEILDLRNLALSRQGITYDFLLTHDEFLLTNVKNSFLTEFGSCWIKDPTPKKEYSLSFLCGGKTITEGHQLRQSLWNREQSINNIQKKFFISGNFKGNLQNSKLYPTLGTTKNPLFESQFHICIENIKSNNWFTEKLIDCFYTKTIPIYWGCPNINAWFDTRGMIVVNTVDDIIDAAQNLNDSLYESLMPHVHENFARCQKFVDINEHIRNKLLQVLQ